MSKSEKWQCHKAPPTVALLQWLCHVTRISDISSRPATYGTIQPGKEVSTDWSAYECIAICQKENVVLGHITGQLMFCWLCIWPPLRMQQKQKLLF